MAVNDREIGANIGSDVHPGVANPTSHSQQSNPLVTNFVNDPTTDEVGAGAGSNFQGHQQAQRTFKETAGVVEGRPGIIESSNIDPLNENSNKDDGWANVKPTNSTAPGVTDRLWNVADGVSNVAYGVLTGDKSATKSGKDSLGFGERK
ncbi:hypothetical protein BJ138DRAFT_1008360 [Hygrophoropsis aurantiaca]|uniref:Uncharacterized protein n=1 Tax=Hygrophoropsis aurantiaca TaxID=72124 RepID=A0ACB8AC30_9AGAM|nr:hypothetical protein BJ138DRAFT_1008360 [Hygrophoropsis aurantiaca]